MATFDYDKTLATAIRLITKFGNPVEMVRGFSETDWTRTYSPTTNSFTWEDSSGTVVTEEPSDVTETADGALVGIGDTFLDNSLVQQSDGMLLIVEISKPQVGDEFTINGKVYKYIAHKTINPAGTVLLYKIAVRE